MVAIGTYSSPHVFPPKFAQQALLIDICLKLRTMLHLATHELKDGNISARGRVDAFPPHPQHTRLRLASGPRVLPTLLQQHFSLPD
jgi:hypothetical protein